MDDAVPQPAHPEPAPLDDPQPPAAAYFTLADALEALEQDHHHHCAEARFDVRLRFLDIRDYRIVSVVTQRFTCLRREMEARGAVTVGVQVRPARLECPDTIAELGT